MAKLSISCRPLVQGMMLLLLALLLLASIQAVQVQAVPWGPVGEILEGVEHKVAKGVRGVGEDVREDLRPYEAPTVGEEVQKAQDKVVKMTYKSCKKQQGYIYFCKGAKTGYEVHKYSCKALGWVDQQYPEGFERFIASNMPSFEKIQDSANGIFTCQLNDVQAEPATAAAGTEPEQVRVGFLSWFL